jgi:predicted metal-dependent HD superfamily phosphohydrolase
MAPVPTMSIFEFDNNPIIFKARYYVTGLINTYLPKTFLYHNLHHTLNVVEKCYELGKSYCLKDVEMETLLLAAWFHDTGYCLNAINHEDESVKIAFIFLNEFGVTTDYRSKVESLILVTKPSAKPTTLAEEILCDADMHHLGSEDYFKWSRLLKQELELKIGRQLSEEEWNLENISFFKSHHYFTDYARSHWETQKLKNLAQLKG